MSNHEEAFKIVLHSDDAFLKYLERMGSEPVKETLQKMRMTLETQINKWGEERKEWHTKATSLLTVVKVRLTEVQEWENDHLAVYKELVADLLGIIHRNCGIPDLPVPDGSDLDAVDAWIEELGL